MRTSPWFLGIAVTAAIFLSIHSSVPDGSWFAAKNVPELHTCRRHRGFLPHRDVFQVVTKRRQTRLHAAMLQQSIKLRTNSTTTRISTLFVYRLCPLVSLRVLVLALNGAVYSWRASRLYHIVRRQRIQEKRMLVDAS